MLALFTFAWVRRSHMGICKPKATECNHLYHDVVSILDGFQKYLKKLIFRIFNISFLVMQTQIAESQRAIATFQVINSGHYPKKSRREHVCLFFLPSPAY